VKRWESEGRRGVKTEGRGVKTGGRGLKTESHGLCTCHRGGLCWGRRRSRRRRIRAGRRRRRLLVVTPGFMCGLATIRRGNDGLNERAWRGEGYM
jgi:hypothetical protein